MFCVRVKLLRVAMKVTEGPSVSTGIKSTHRLGRPARVDLPSTTVMFKQFAPRRGAGDRTQARVGGFAWVKKRFGIRSGRVLHWTYLRGHRTKGSAVTATATQTVRGRDQESAVWGVGLTV